MKYYFTAKKKEAIKRVLGYKYIQVISDYLLENGIKNTKGEPYSNNSIRVLMNTQTSNKIVFAKILELYSIKKAEQKKLENKLKKIA